MLEHLFVVIYFSNSILLTCLLKPPCYYYCLLLLAINIVFILYIYRLVFILAWLHNILYLYLLCIYIIFRVSIILFSEPVKFESTFCIIIIIIVSWNAALFFLFSEAFYGKY